MHGGVGCTFACNNTPLSGPANNHTEGMKWRFHYMVGWDWTGQEHIITFSCDNTPLCSSAHMHETAVVLMAPATFPAFHTQLGMIMSFTTTTAKSPNLFRESMVDEAFITSFDRREKNLSRTSGSFSGLRLVTITGMMSSRSSPITDPVTNVHGFTNFI